MKLTQELKTEYGRLFEACTIKPERAKEVGAIIAQILANKKRYAYVGNLLSVPWEFIGVIHNMESGMDFTKHLHNGDSLTSRTIHIPKGRPKLSYPPFTWEASAVDALRLRKLDKVSDWSPPGMLYQLECYNGWGYRQYHKGTLSPYLWAGSNHYRSGKYTSDGRFSYDAISKQVGAAVLLKAMYIAQQSVLNSP